MMKKCGVRLACAMLIPIMGFGFSGCRSKGVSEEVANVSSGLIEENPINGEKGDTSNKKEIPNHPIKYPSESGTELSFEASYVRTGKYSIEKKYPIITICKTLQDLESHGLKVSELQLRSEPTSMLSSIQSDVKKHDEEFFKRKSLIAITISETSGSIRDKVEKVVKDGNKIYVYIGRKVPEIGTMDMTEWTIYVELDADAVKGEEEVYLIFRDI
ncbi:MAG: hypothetical protein RSA29_07115 [Clostridium sp.]|uniref:hypothetical protein n=1 Tax=Clostridium sp. TaxID=1506 RepID=UPI00306960A3